MNRPNILLLHVDEQRFDSLRAYGNREVITPNLDQLEGESVVYDNHFCCYPVCTPSRYSLFTGRYVSQHLGWSNHCTIPSGMSTFPKYLRQAGYHTAAVGKMHMTPTYLDIGFDRMTLAEQDGNGRFDDDYHKDLKAHGLLDDIDLIDQRSEYRKYATEDYFKSFGAKVSDLPEEFHSTNWITDRALEELEEWDDKTPHLLMVGYIKPHHPFDPSQRYLRMYDGKEVTPLPGYTPAVPEADYCFNRGYFNNADLDEETLRKVTRYYYASITQIDDQIGRVLKKLRDKGLYDNTLIIYTSDHGDYMGFHHMMLKANHLYDPVMKIPLMIKYPKDAAKRGRCGALSDNTQLANHVLNLCGLSGDSQMNREALESDREYAFGQYCTAGENGAKQYYMVRSKRYKLLAGDHAEKMMFFDLQKDPLELYDLGGKEEYQILMQKHWDALCRAFLFSYQSHVNVEEDAPLIPGKDHPTEKERREMAEYFRSRSAVGPLLQKEMESHGEQF